MKDKIGKHIRSIDEQYVHGSVQTCDISRNSHSLYIKECTLKCINFTCMSFFIITLADM